jgi:hypothetical protein
VYVYIFHPSPIKHVPRYYSLIHSTQVYVCSDANWTGHCEHHISPLGTAPSDCTVLDGTASAIGPDVGFDCYFYTYVSVSLLAVLPQGGSKYGIG